MSDLEPTDPLEIARQFQVRGRVLSVDRLGSGHIHRTWASTVETPSGMRRYVHQRINETVFADPVGLMENIERVTGHLRSRVTAEGGDPERETLTVVEAEDGQHLLRTEAGDCWRTFRYIEGTHAFDAAQGPSHAFEAARSFGLFLRRISDLPEPGLHETVPRFGDTRMRFDAFVAAIEQDPLERACEVRPEIAALLERESLSRLLVDALASGAVPPRIVHYDTKINNVLIDAATGKGQCVIDLDTTMQGTALYDFGDLVRLGATRSAEDEADPSRMTIDPVLFEALVRGYLVGTAGLLVPGELERLVDAARGLIYTAAVRFLTDYLEGDRYFRVEFQEHNLTRCRAQLALLIDLEARADALSEIVRNCS